MPSQMTFPFDGPVPPGYEWIYRPWITHRKTGKRIYPKRAKFFRLLVKRK